MAELLLSLGMQTIFNSSTVCEAADMCCNAIQHAILLPFNFISHVCDHRILFHMSDGQRRHHMCAEAEQAKHVRIDVTIAVKGRGQPRLQAVCDTL